MVQEMSITTYSPQDTHRLGVVLGQILDAGDVVLLFGALGAGKTTFSKGIATGLAIDEDVTSPTFTLVHEYNGRIPLIHMDLYRLYGDSGTVNAGRLAELGWEDYLESDAAVLVEWPEAIAHEIPDALLIRVVRAPLPRIDERTFECKTNGARSWRLLDEWVKKWLF